MWTERHRPQTLDAVQTAANTALIARIKSDPSKTPHLLLHGGAGTGKTSFALALRNHLFDTAHRETWCKMLNASDKRGIDVVRGEIADFCESFGMFSDALAYPFKLLILDEADSMTPDAQRDLKNKVEAYSSNVRFVFIGNIASKIIDPLHSRCTVMRFMPLPRTVAASHLASVAAAESMDLDGDVVDCIVDFSRGDMRKSVQLLQTLSRLPAPHNAVQFWDCVGRPSPGTMRELSVKLKREASSSAFDAFSMFRDATSKYMTVDVLAAATEAGLFTSAAALQKAAELEIRLLAEGGSSSDAHTAAFVGLLITA